MKFSQLNFHQNFKNLGSNFSKAAQVQQLDQQKIVAFSSAAAELIDLDEESFLQELGAEFLQTNNPKFSNISQAYAGHQFRNFVPSLGDGRAVLLAQLFNSKNESWDLVIKGSGITPFSRPYVRNADGRAVLRSSIREFLISEALHFLNIPTSRALCLIASEELIMRESLEKAAQIIRLAPSHIRFGTFEYFFYQENFDQIKILADHLKQDHPQLFLGQRSNIYANFLQQVVTSTALMLAKWQAFGFCHGVMNTDNMSIHGISFDFGPFGFLDEFNKNHICNTSDYQGLYSFINQPQAAFWDLNAFAITLSSLVEMSEIKEILESYYSSFFDNYHNLMAAKLGFLYCDEEVKNLIYQTLELLQEKHYDYSHFFSNIDDYKNQNPESSAWFSQYQELLQKHFMKFSANFCAKKSAELMQNANPQFILRNHLLQNAIKMAEDGDFSEVQKLLEISKKPFTKQEIYQEYYSLPPSWAKEIRISCSS